MPYSFFEIEERRTRNIGRLFVFLILFYLFSLWVLVVLFRVAMALVQLFGLMAREARDLAAPVDLSSLPSAGDILLLSPGATALFLLAALAIGFGHWHLSINNAVSRVIRQLGARKPDADDTYHQRFRRIVEEVSVATGGVHLDCVVVPASSMNAFSVADLRHTPIIGVTEGLLSRLNREELETVVGHEAAHVISRDSLVNTAAVSLFDVYGLILRQSTLRLERVLHGERFVLPPHIFIYPVLPFMIALTWFLHGMGRLVGMFVSRECEYRADAVAVRLTRNPLALARSLHIIGHHWRGGGTGHQRLAPLFIVNPGFSPLDEEEGWLSDLFSTHPPLARRIRILLDLAHAPGFDFADTVSPTAALETAPTPLAERRWLINNGTGWEGPYDAPRLLALPFLRNDSPVQREGAGKIVLAHDDAALCELLRDPDSAIRSCPRCFHRLERARYEGTIVLRCANCRGVLVKEDKVARILLRREMGFTDDVAARADVVLTSGRAMTSSKLAAIPGELSCPACSRMMHRGLYSIGIPVEVDRCHPCASTWFDGDELEIVQYCVENG